MKFLLSLLNSENENVSELATSVISHSCDRTAEQKAILMLVFWKDLFSLLKGPSNQRYSCLESIAAIVRNNSEVATKFACINNGKALNTLAGLIQDRSLRTRLLASVCLIAIRCASPWYVQELPNSTKLILTLVELLEEPGRVGDDAPFAMSDLIAGNEELHKLEVSVNAIEKLCNFLSKGTIQANRLEGILLALGELCSKLESCRQQLMSLEVLDKIAAALKHDSVPVRIAACMCIKSISRSVKGVAALEAICNVAIGFTHQNHPIFVQCRGVTQLVQLAKSMDSSIRFKSVCALRNLLFLADEATARSILSELTISTFANLISDPELLIQERALALTANFIDGHLDSIEYLLSDDSNIIVAIVRKLHRAYSLELCFQGMCVLNNIAAGDESHIEPVMSYVIPLQANECTAPFIIKFMQSKHNKVRTASVWCIVNLTQPGRYWIGYLLDLEDKVKVKGGVLMQASFLRIKHLEGDGTVLPTHCYSRGE